MFKSHTIEYSGLYSSRVILDSQYFDYEVECAGVDIHILHKNYIDYVRVPKRVNYEGYIVSINSVGFSLSLDVGRID